MKTLAELLAELAANARKNEHLIGLAELLRPSELRPFGANPLGTNESKTTLAALAAMLNPVPPPATSALLSFLAPDTGKKHMTVGERFQKFLANLMLTTDQRSDGRIKHSGVRACLNRHYYGITSDSANSLLVGSWGKLTEIRPPRDIDIMFILPYSVYERYQRISGNKQSQLLQEVKGVLQRTYSTTSMRGDGQVVMVPFSSYAVEVLPAIKLTNGQYWICDTNAGGRYKTIDPTTEINHVHNSNNATSGNTRDLIRMMKKWQGVCNVPLKSFCIELLAIDFLSTWEYRGRTTVYYDWMVRDFFKYLIGKAYSYVFVPGTSESIYLGDAWKSRAESAYNRAKIACEHESENRPYSAGEEWQKIFGTYIPVG